MDYSLGLLGEVFGILRVFAIANGQKFTSLSLYFYNFASVLLERLDSKLTLASFVPSEKSLDHGRSSDVNVKFINDSCVQLVLFFPGLGLDHVDQVEDALCRLAKAVWRVVRARSFDRCRFEYWALVLTVSR